MSDCLIFDLHEAPGSQWSTFTSLPGPRGGGGMVHSISANKLIFAAGAIRPTPGKGSAVDQNEAWQYDLGQGSNGVWVALPDIPYFANHISYATVYDQTGQEHHYFLGGQAGQNQNSGNFDLVYEYSLVSSTWIQRMRSDLPRGHASSSTFAYGCGLIVIGGNTNNGKTGDISYYDVPSDAWTSIGNLGSTPNTPVCVVYTDLNDDDWIHCESPRGLSKRCKITIP